MSCHVVTNRHGRLALRLNWQGRRSWEGTGLADTPENRRRVEALAELVNAELRAGIFDARRYLHYFPGGTRRGATADGERICGRRRPGTERADGARALQGLDRSPGSACRAAGATPRRHTFISLALTAGVNIKWLAEHCGTSVAMIERHYGRFLSGSAAEQLELIEARERRSQGLTEKAKVVTLAAGSPNFAEKPLWSKASPTGFEPVSPA